MEIVIPEKKISQMRVLDNRKKTGKERVRVREYKRGGNF